MYLFYVLLFRFNKYLEAKLMSAEMDFLRISARYSGLDKIRNNAIREKFYFRLYKKQTVKLVWPRAKIDQEWPPRRILDWCSHLEDEEREELVIPGCRRLQQE